MPAPEPSRVASERVADFLAGKILSGELRPGDRIKQDELAAELNTSRIPVRDALRILETRGLVSLQANVGARVASLSVRDMEMSYTIREMLEPMLLAESILNLTENDLAAMRETRSALWSVESVDEYMRLTRRFHWTAFSGHSAPMLAQIVERLWDSTQSYRRAYARLALQDEVRMQVMRSERDLLLGAIERRELDLAPKMLALHIRRTKTSLSEYAHLIEVLE